jgi:hypothetical protein
MTGSDVQERFGPAMTDKAPREEREWEECLQRQGEDSVQRRDDQAAR